MMGVIYDLYDIRMADNFPTMALKDVQALFRNDFFQNGMRYYDGKQVHHLSRFENKIYAQVEGSGGTNYNIMIESAEKLTPYCTCPAARRYPFCKHVAAVLVGWARDASAFVVAEQAPEFTKPGTKKARVKKGKTETEDLLARGLESLETLTTELILSGLATITPGRVEQVRDLAENLRTYKLRRLSSLLTHFADILSTLLTDKDNFALSAYADVLADIVLTAKGVQGIQQGKLKDPKYMEELVGKTWQDKELTARNNLGLVGVFFEQYTTPDEFAVFSNYFAELATGEILTKKFIIPKSLLKRTNNADKQSYCGRKLLVSEALVYPGFPPLRLKLKDFTESAVSVSEVEQLTQQAHADFDQEVTAFQTFKKDFFAPADYYALLRPQGFYAAQEGMLMFDAQGKAFELVLTDRSALNLETLLQNTSISALFGKIQARSGSLKFEALSAVVLSPENPVKLLT